MWQVTNRAEAITVKAGAGGGGTAAGQGGPAGLPRRRDPDLASIAAFTLDDAGAVTAWPATAAGLFGLAPAAMTGRDICDVLLTGPGQRELVRRALAGIRDGRIWNATVAGGELGEGRFAIRFEPVAGPGAGAVVLARRASPQATFSWLGDSAARIGSTLDPARTAAEVAEAIVPGFADAAAVYVAERLLTADDATALVPGRRATTVRRLAARLGGHGAEFTDLLLQPGEILVFGQGTPAATAMQTGQPVQFDQLDGETTERLLRRPGGEIAADYASFLMMPLIARGEIVGCVMFGRALASPAFNSDDIAQARELAARAAVYIDNARLYDQERRTALALKRGLLPSHPDIPPGLEVAHRYLPVGDSVIGGDWHDIVALPGGRAALIVGDVMGHGPEAAATMAQLRTAAHTLAELNLPPAQILSRLDQMVARMTTAQFATCIYAVTDPAASTCTIAQAGHLPPVLIHPDGGTEVLALPPGLPVGLGAEYVIATEVSLPRGAVLAMFTDGLVESRTRSLDDGLTALQAALSASLAQPGVRLTDACGAVINELCGYREDDITLLLSRVRGNS